MKCAPGRLSCGRLSQNSFSVEVAMRGMPLLRGRLRGEAARWLTRTERAPNESAWLSSWDAKTVLAAAGGRRKAPCGHELPAADFSSGRRQQQRVKTSRVASVPAAAEAARQCSCGEAVAAWFLPLAESAHRHFATRPFPN